MKINQYKSIPLYYLVFRLAKKFAAKKHIPGKDEIIYALNRQFAAVERLYDIMILQLQRERRIRLQKLDRLKKEIEILKLKKQINLN